MSDVCDSTSQRLVDLFGVVSKVRIGVRVGFRCIEQKGNIVGGAASDLGGGSPASYYSKMAWLGEDETKAK